MPFVQVELTSSSNCGSSMILGREDVAGRPGNLSSEEGEGLDEDSGLDCHVAVMKICKLICSLKQSSE